MRKRINRTGFVNAGGHSGRQRTFSEIEGAHREPRGRNGGSQAVDERITGGKRNFARGGDIVVPNDLGAPIQWIDVRDLAQFVVDGIDHRRGAIVNAVGPIRQIVDPAKESSDAVVGATATIAAVSRVAGSR